MAVMSSRSSAVSTSVRKPSASACLLAGSYTPSYTARPMCSRNPPKMRSSTLPIWKAVWRCSVVGSMAAVPLAALELGVPLLHEGRASLHVVLAAEALLDQAGARLHVALFAVLDRLPDRELGGLHRERSVRRDRPGQLSDGVF